MLVNEMFFDFSKISGFSLTVAIVGYVIVFSALVIMYFAYNTIPKIINFKIRQKLRREGKEEAQHKELHITGDVNAAISMALYLYFNEIHDVESDVITIERIPKQYSPWSSKIYSTNTYFKSR